MATNITRYLQQHFALPVVVTDPAVPASGDPVRFGELTGIALTKEGEGGNLSTETTVWFGAAAVNVSVKGIDGAGNSAVALGDAIYYVDADTPKLSKKASGFFFGFALATVGSGATATISVLHAPAGSFTGTVNTGDIAAGAVTAPKLSSTLKTGFIPVSLGVVREVFTNQLGTIVQNGGLLATDTTPILEYTNGDTDSAWRINWAAANVDPISFQVPLPPDLDEAADVEVHFRAKMSGATNTPTISADLFVDEGDTKVTVASTALSATVAEKIIALGAADVPAGAQTLSVELTPGAHATDAIHMTAIWIEYTRA